MGFWKLALCVAGSFCLVNTLPGLSLDIYIIYIKRKIYISLLPSNNLVSTPHRTHALPLKHTYTYMYIILTLSATTQQAGTIEPLLENLPGAPDGVSSAPDGSFWVALVSPIPPIAKILRDPTVRSLYAWLPTWARPPLKKWGAVVKVCACVCGCVRSRSVCWLNIIRRCGSVDVSGCERAAMQLMHSALFVTRLPAR